MTRKRGTRAVRGQESSSAKPVFFAIKLSMGVTFLGLMTLLVGLLADQGVLPIMPAEFTGPVMGIGGFIAVLASLKLVLFLIFWPAISEVLEKKEQQPVPKTRIRKRRVRPATEGGS